MSIISPAPAAEAEAAAAAPANPKKIIIAGAPASGKGTQCERIREEFKCVHLSTGQQVLIFFCVL